MRNPRVFMDLSIDASPPKRLVIQLFYDVMPKTAENFRALCTGEMGIGKTYGKPLHYKGSVFHHFVPHFGALGGDFSKRDGTGGAETIYGGAFPAERNPFGRSGLGVLMTVNEGSDTTGSLFLVCFKHSVFLEGNHDAFGKVIEGLETISHLEQLGRHALVKITDCGEVSDKPQTRSDDDPFNALWDRWLSTPSTNPDLPNLDLSTMIQVSERLAANKLRFDREAASKKPPPSSPYQMSESKQVAEGLSNKLLVVTNANESEKPSSSNSDEKRESNAADISTLIRVVEELSNKLLVQKRSDDTRKFRRGARKRSARISSLRKPSKKSGSSISEVENSTVMVESDKELENENQRFQHDPIMSIVDVRAEKKGADKKRPKSKVDWPVIAALIVAGAAIFRR